MTTTTPLVFNFLDFIQGKGFGATVAMSGRAIVTAEDANDFWIDGVQPGSFGGGDTTLPGALADFKVGYLSVLYDMAAEAATFADFQKAVTAFFAYVSPTDFAAWNEARKALPSGGAVASALREVPAETCEPSLSVEEYRPACSTPEGNQMPVFRTAA